MQRQMAERRILQNVALASLSRMIPSFGRKPKTNYFELNV